MSVLPAIPRFRRRKPVPVLRKELVEWKDLVRPAKWAYRSRLAWIVIPGLALIAIAGFLRFRTLHTAMDWDGGRESCPIHDREFLYTTVRIGYGMPASVFDDDPASRDSRAWWEASRKAFPYARPTKVHAGCGRQVYFVGGIPISRYIWARAAYCDECEEAERDWMNARSNPPVPTETPSG